MKKYTEKEIEELKKSLHKSVLKYLKSEHKGTASEIVRDVLDPNYHAEVDPDKIPTHQKESVINKSGNTKQNKGVKKLKEFIKNKKTKKNCNL